MLSALKPVAQIAACISRLLNWSGVPGRFDSVQRPEHKISVAELVPGNDLWPSKRLQTTIRAHQPNYLFVRRRSSVNGNSAFGVAGSTATAPGV